MIKKIKKYETPEMRLAASLLDQIKHSARSNVQKKRANTTTAENNERKEIGVDIDILKNKLDEIDYRCEETGIPFPLFERRIRSGDMHLYDCNPLLQASVDRIDNKGGYTIDNIKIVCQFINIGRNTKTYEQMVDVIDKIKNPPKQNKIVYNYNPNIKGI
jgi:hypothetical protein